MPVRSKSASRLQNVRWWFFFCSVAQCKVINLARNNMLALGTRDDGVFFSVLSFFCYPLMLYAAQVATPTGVTFATVCVSARLIPSSPACAYLRTSHPCISLEKSLGSTGEMIMAGRENMRRVGRCLGHTMICDAAE